MSNYQIYGGIAEEEFVDVQDQDFVGSDYGTGMDHEEDIVDHFGGRTTIGTTDVQYAKDSRGEIGGGGRQPEEVYYDGIEGGEGEEEKEGGGRGKGEVMKEGEGEIDHHLDGHLLEEVKQMNLEAEQQQKGGPEWVREGEAAAAVPGHVEANVPTGAEEQNGETTTMPEAINIIDDAAAQENGDEDPPTPTALVPPTTPKVNDRPLSEIMAAETQYPIPYRSKLTEPFEPGQTLIVKGKTAEDSVRFTINLHHASADFSGNDVPLHISVRFDEGKIVFNTFSKGEWGKEERKSNPYKKGDDIDIRIRAHDSKFTIFADQKEVKEYEHRVPLSSISHFSIDGDVLITHIHWGGKYYPVPYESGITGDGFNPGKTMLIFGTPEKKGKRFHINLLKKNGDIALHFNPRFDEKAIVRNSLIANEWGNEEREGKNPLEKGIGFDLKIINEEYAFQIFLNEDRFCSYAHRMEPHDIHGLQIGGDVEITGIQIF